MEVLATALDKFIYDSFLPIVLFTLYISLGLLMFSLVFRTIVTIISREIAIRRIHDSSITGVETTNHYVDTDEDTISLALNVYFPNVKGEQLKIRDDRALKENISEDTEVDASIGVKRYKVDISPIPTCEEEYDELERRREQEYNKFLQSLSDKEKEEIQQDMDSHIRKADIISYQEMYLVYKGIEKEYRSKMIHRLDNLEKNLLNLQGLITRGGVSEKSSIIYMKRYRLMRREIELYKTIIEHESLLRKLFDIESQLRRLVNTHPFLVKGYSSTKGHTKKVTLRAKPIGDIRDKREKEETIYDNIRKQEDIKQVNKPPQKRVLKKVQKRQ